MTDSNTKLALLLLKIPGMTDDGPASSFELNGKTLTLKEVLGVIREAHTESALTTISILQNATTLTRSELQLLISTLFSLAGPSNQGELVAKQAAESLIAILCAHSHNLEALYLAAQILKRWEQDPMHEALSATLSGIVIPSLGTVTFTADLSRKQLLEQRYVLLKALETKPLQEVAISVISGMLENQEQRLISARKELAGSVLSTTNALLFQSSELQGLKRLAAVVFATGIAPRALNQTQLKQGIKTQGLLVTAQDAEKRLQFGLASAVELHKAMRMLGRVMSIQEYELALTFELPNNVRIPANQSWFSREEWATAHRLVLLALKDRLINPAHSLALLHLLATKVKVEDPADNRESRRRADLLSRSERQNAIQEISQLASERCIPLEEFSSLADEKYARLFQPEFLTANPTASIPEEGAATEDAALATKQRGALELALKILRDNSSSLISRLIADDFDLLRQVNGLEVEQFRQLLECIRGRAVSEPWARVAFLDIVRARQANSVTASVRTSALGSLVNEARKLGRLTNSFEKEVFAVSAEIPHLSFLVQQSSSALSENDPDPVTE